MKDVHITLGPGKCHFESCRAVTLLRSRTYVIVGYIVLGGLGMSFSDAILLGVVKSSDLLLHFGVILTYKLITYRSRYLFT